MKKIVALAAAVLLAFAFTDGSFEEATAAGGEINQVSDNSPRERMGYSSDQECGAPGAYCRMGTDAWSGSEDADWQGCRSRHHGSDDDRQQGLQGRGMMRNEDSMRGNRGSHMFGNSMDEAAADCVNCGQGAKQGRTDCPHADSRDSSGCGR